MTREGPLLLHGVFRELVRNQLPLGVSDYLDALRALQVQLGRETAPPSLGRESLRRLCHVMWARSPGEVRLIDRIFSSIPPPGDDEISAVQPLIEGAVPSLTPLARPGTDSRDAGDPDRAPAVGRGAQAAAGQQEVAVSFEPVAQGGGVALPHPVVSARGAETFVMQPQTVMSPRALAVLWRRYRRMVRTGPRTELDVDATVKEKSRRGILHQPVMRSPRTNTARLLILADASPSMSAWRPFLEALATSLTLSRLPAVRLLYFANVPRRSLFASPDLTGAVAAQKVYDAFADAALLFVSDGGAARGFLNRSRVEQTRRFLSAANRQMRSVVWINPMPPGRWRGTTAEASASGTTTVVLPLTQPAMIRAVDILRGARTH
jgi:uncharacterized protein with von Willebrand factor type A (vWA) domain